MTKRIVIIGAGPAGLTAAHELQTAGETDITILEADVQIGGISRTVKHNGNRIDIGGHRFFSKSDWVMNWWASILPLATNNGTSPLSVRDKDGGATPVSSPESQSRDNTAVMMLRNRLSRIYYNRQFFDYPLKINGASLRKLGLAKTLSFGISYVAARLRPVHPETTLESFLVNRFGKRLYAQFFKEYTEKVWGVPCNEISAEWGSQRIKSLSIMKAVGHAVKSALGFDNGQTAQTSLIESFLYPKFGPGQMWESVADKFIAGGGKIRLQARAVELKIEDGRVRCVTFADPEGRRESIDCTHTISTMPVKDLILASRAVWPDSVVHTATNLAYRDFITVGLLYHASDLPRPLQDNWIYVQEPGVQVGRVQVFNNWSPYMVTDQDTVWLGLEFFCKEGDSIWAMSDEALKQLAQREMKQIGLVSASQAIDSVAIRVPKAYPGYFGDAYNNFDQLRSALDTINNLFLIGRNGMHRYNNQDHSMLTAKEAAEQIISGDINKNRIWEINVGDEYHEEAKAC